MRQEPKAVIEQISAAKRWVKRAQGKFSAYVFAQEVGIQDVQLRDQVLDELVGRGILDRDEARNGWYHRIDAHPEPMDWQNAQVELAPVVLPLGLTDKAYISPGNIIILAGETNAGKTAFALNVIYINLLHQGGAYERVRYLNSEMHPAELKGRLLNIDRYPDAWEGLDAYSRTRDFHHVIDPHGLNVIDYLENLDNFYLIGDKIAKIHEALDTGIALICLQKKRGELTARGGDFTLEKARLGLSMFYDGFVNYLHITKCKFPVAYPNPQGQEIDFSIADGGRSFDVRGAGWEWVTSEMRAARTRTHENEARLNALKGGGNKGFMA